MNIVISGASSGIGFEVAKQLVALGHQVFAFARNENRLKDLQKECDGDGLFIYAFDITEFDHYPELISRISTKFSKVDVLINNAGALVNKPFEQLNLKDFGTSFSVNTKAPFYLSQQLLPLMGEGSHILNISSMGGYQGSSKFPGLSLYSASKGALSILSECMAEELGEKGIKVNCLALGAAQTEMLEKAFPGYQAPLSANEMAEFISDFAINGHRYFNGKILPISVSTP
ncbi:MAG: short-chain dehydrogenase [Bacteroidetes bacterium]|nr:short-chain dehydrogenase [Bacteroidota bacterium]